MTSDGEPYARARYKAIIEEQVSLAYLTQGGVTYGDSNEMTPNERNIALETMREILEKRNESIKNSTNSSNSNSNSREPRTLGR